jgi:hypothetical protein
MKTERRAIDAVPGIAEITLNAAQVTQLYANPYARQAQSAGTLTAVKARRGYCTKDASRHERRCTNVRIVGKLIDSNSSSNLTV